MMSQKPPKKPGPGGGGPPHPGGPPGPPGPPGPICFPKPKTSKTWLSLWETSLAKQC